MYSCMKQQIFFLTYAFLLFLLFFGFWLKLAWIFYFIYIWCHIMLQLQLYTHTLVFFCMVFFFFFVFFAFLYDANDSKGFNRKTFSKLENYICTTLSKPWDKEKKLAYIKTKIMTTLNLLAAATKCCTSLLFLLLACSLFYYNKVRKNCKIIFIFLYYIFWGIRFPFFLKFFSFCFLA